MKDSGLNRYLPFIIFVVVAVIGLGMTAVVKNAEDMAVQSRFEVVADDAADRVRERVTQHIAFLQAAHSYFIAHNGQIRREQFATFINGLDLSNRFKGIQGIGFAKRIPVGEETSVEMDLLTSYGINREIWPETSEDQRTPIVLLEPSEFRNNAALGYDMYADPVRRAAMNGAVVTDGPYASAPVELVQEITSEKQAGFLVYIPLLTPDIENESGEVIGFVYAPFRAGDLHLAAFSRSPQLPVAIETTDVTGAEETFIYQSPNFEDAGVAGNLEVDRSLDIAGREWNITVRATSDFRNSSGVGTFALAAISLLLAAAIAASTRSQLMAVSAARELNTATEKSLQDKEMMLQEMKHRIKNSIARVLAIARQTAAHSDTLDDFSSSFMARLQAMGNAQDMLTRSHWQRADLNELISTELEQVFGSEAAFEVSGPATELNERATQSLGLVFHELATNALKYGSISEDGGSLRVDWSKSGKGKSAELVVNWVETSPTPVSEPEGHGFGTRLIDANVKGELSGNIEKSFETSGLSVRLTIPASAYS